MKNVLHSTRRNCLAIFGFAWNASALHLIALKRSNRSKWKWRTNCNWIQWMGNIGAVELSVVCCAVRPWTQFSRSIAYFAYSCKWKRKITVIWFEKSIENCRQIDLVDNWLCQRNETIFTFYLTLIIQIELCMAEAKSANRICIVWLGIFGMNACTMVIRSWISTVEDVQAAGMLATDRHITKVCVRAYYKINSWVCLVNNWKRSVWLCVDFVCVRMWFWMIPFILWWSTTNSHHSRPTTFYSPNIVPFAIRFTLAHKASASLVQKLPTFLTFQTGRVPFEIRRNTQYVLIVYLATAADAIG